MGGGWLLVAAMSDSETTSDARVKADAAGEHLDLEGRLLVRAVDPSNERLNGRATTVALGEGGVASRRGPLSCQRIYQAAGRGICLRVAASGVDYRMEIFDARQQRVHEETLDGIPSRARVSRTGRWGSVTTFVDGHSYATDSGFSTKTLIIDMRSGKSLANLEQFDVYKDGEKIDAPDFNFWGTTFADDDDTFYATLGTGGKRSLVKGSLRERRVDVLRENVECPSLSPDQSRIAYKKRVGGPSDWRLHVLDLESGRDVAAGRAPLDRRPGRVARRRRRALRRRHERLGDPRRRRRAARAGAAPSRLADGARMTTTLE